MRCSHNTFVTLALFTPRVTAFRSTLSPPTLAGSPLRTDESSAAAGSSGEENSGEEAEEELTGRLADDLPVGWTQSVDEEGDVVFIE